MSAPSLPETTSFAAELRAATQPDHGAAEGAGFMQALMEGALDASAVGDLAARLLPVYRSMETATATYGDDAVLGPVLDPGLIRTPSLETDVAALRPEVGPSPAVEVYLARLTAVCGRPDLLLAHHYTRYLGDLSGGQAIGALVRRHYGLSESATSFYAFPAIDDAMAFKRSYREHLDRLPALGVDTAAFIDEVRTAYALNRGLIDELGALHAPRG
jgi:heme oxygenase (biliverdin-producing, ferredoxin)